MIRNLLKSSLLLGLLALISVCAKGQAVQRFSINDSPGTDIDLSKDHYSVAIVGGWVSSKNSALKTLLSSPQPLTISIDTTLRSSDPGSTPVSISEIFHSPDKRSRLDQPLGFDSKFLTNLPGEIQTQLVIKMTIPKEDRLAKVFDQLDSNKQALPANVFAAPWIGYSKVVNSILGSFVGTSEPSYPFYWQGAINLGAGSLKQGYVVLVAQNRTGDAFFSSPITLTREEATGLIFNNGNRLTDHTYVVLRVFKDVGFTDFEREMVNSTTEPWAILARKQLDAQVLKVALQKATSKETLKATSDNIAGQLIAEKELLANDKRLSGFDVLQFSKYFSHRTYQLVNDQCFALHITFAECPLASFESQAPQTTQ